MNRREFLGIVGVGAFHKLALPKFAAPLRKGVSTIPSGSRRANRSRTVRAILANGLPISLACQLIGTPATR